jgi:hypothetical protein
MLSSARMRRRLFWIGGIAGLVGIVVALAVVVFPSSKPWSAEKLSNQKADIVHVPKQRRFDRSEAPAVLETAKNFVRSAVEQKNLAASWDVVAPSMKVGFTKRSWVKGGALPVVPYPAYLPRARWQLSFSYPTEVGMRVSLFPKPHSKMKPVVFDIVERKYGHTDKTRWLVSSFTPAPSASGDFGSHNSYSPGSAVTVASGVRRTSAIWLFLPFGVLVGGLILGLGGVLGYKAWRNAAIYRAYVRENQRST